MGSVWHDRDVADSLDDLAARDTAAGSPVDGRPPRPTPPLVPTAPLPPAHVVEPAQPKRIRRPNDGLRLAAWAAVTGLLLVAGDVALGTTAGLEADLSSAIDRRLPDLILQILAYASNLLLLLLPPLILADLALRRRWRTLWVAVAAGVAGWLVAYAFSVLGPEFLSDPLLDALTTGSARGSRSAVAFPMVAAVVALASVDGLRGRPRLSITVWGAALGFSTLLIFDQSATPLALAVSAAGGRAVGLAFRYGVGTVNPRPNGREVAEALARVAVPLSYLNGTAKAMTSVTTSVTRSTVARSMSGSSIETGDLPVCSTSSIGGCGCKASSRDLLPGLFVAPSTKLPYPCSPRGVTASALPT